MQQESPAVGKDVREHLAQGHLVAEASSTGLGLADGIKQRRQQNARQPDDEEQDLPGMDLAHQRKAHGAAPGSVTSNQTAQQKREAGTYVDPGGVEADGYRHAAGRDVIGYQRVCRRREGGFAHSDPHPHHEHLWKRGCNPASSGKEAPQHQPDGDDRSPAVDIHQPPDQDSEEGVEHHEAQPLQVANLGVADVQIATERSHYHAENLAVDEREDVGHHQYADYVPDVNG